MEVDVFPISEREKNATPRAKKQQVSRLVQQNLNGKNAKRYFVQLVNANFTKQDVHVTLTYSDDMLPSSVEQAERDFSAWIRRARALCKKRGVGSPLYVAVLEYRTQEDCEEKERPVRFHWHVIIKCELSRDELEALWTRNGQKLGFSNADRLQPDNGSLEALCNYLTKYPNRKRRWKQSRGLKKPVRKRPNDTRWGQRRIEKLVREGEVFSREFWRRKFPGWEMNSAEPRCNEVTGEWSLTLKLRRVDTSDGAGETREKRTRGRVRESSPILIL
jgi:hypothetical protein